MPKGTKWFDEDDDLEDTLKGDDSIFTDDFEFDEEEESTEEDVLLAELGFDIELAGRYRKSKKPIFSKGTVTADFLGWFIDKATDVQIKNIKKDKLSPKLQEEVPQVVKKTKKIPFNDEIIKKQTSKIAYLTQYLKFLYDLLGRMESDYQFNDVEIDMITKIKEELK